MILLDTNILSALMLRKPDPAVISWLDRQSVESVWTTTITVFEIRFGLESLAGGRRRHQLEEIFNQALEDDLEGRVLPFDLAAARASASIAAQQRKSGRPVEIRDVQIAGIALARKATLATRNIRHFNGLGIHLIDPWKA
jgi:toxin FitB